MSSSRPSRTIGEQGEQSSWDETIYGLSPSVTNLRVSSFRRRVSAACCLNIWLLLALGFASAVILYLIVAPRINIQSTMTTVATFCGTVRGFERSGVIHFLGIPYALPPINENRFRRPVELTTSNLCSRVWLENSSIKHNDTKDFMEYKSPCMQLTPITDQIIGSEDCLYLNVFVPKSNRRNNSLKPVVVLINSLFFTYGGANGIPSSEGQEPHPETIRRVDALHVTFNFRVGPLGFLINPITEEANLGLYDQVAALRWVRNNIQSFGGDPTKVTLFGYGSGATCVLSLLYSNLGQNLFDYVWVSSPALAKPDKTVEKAVAESSRFYFCDSEDAGNCYNGLLNRSEDIVRLWNWSYVDTWLKNGMFSFPSIHTNNSSRNLIDNRYLAPQILVHDGELVDTNRWFRPPFNLPTVMGQTAHETALYVVPETLPFLSEKSIREYLKQELAGFAVSERDIMEQYQSASYFAAGCSTKSAEYLTDQEALLTGMTTDARCTCPLGAFVNRFKSFHVPLYRYYLRSNHRRFDPYALTTFVSLAFHGWDGIVYLRGYLTHRDFSKGPTFKQHEDISELTQLSDLLNDAMHSFSRTGKIKTWTSVEEETESVNLIDQGNICKTENFIQTRCKLWSQITQGDPMKFAWRT